MACDTWQAKLDTYLDGELPSAEMSAFDAHVRNCPQCAADALARVQMKRAVRNAGMRFTPSAEFQRKIRETVSAGEKKRPRAFQWAWAAALAAIAATVLLGWNAVQRGRQEALYRELMDQHVATLASANPVDVVSTDRHTVKPWFQGKIPFSFNLPELGGTEFTLLGGRVTYLGTTPGAHLIYEVRQHKISVFLFPAQAPGVPAPASGQFTRLAFHTVSWTQGGLRYFVLGDVSEPDLEKLAGLLKSAA